MKLSICRNDITGDISFELEGRKKLNWEISGFLTGTYCNYLSPDGILSENGRCTLYWGLDHKEFCFAPFDPTADSLEKIRDNILARVKAVREWVKSLDNEDAPNSITFEV